MDCGLAPRCPNRFLSLDGKLLMDAIYDGNDWVDHYTWRLVGSDDNGDVVFDGLCPKHLHPFVSSLIESSARVAPYSSASLHDTDVLKTIRESIDEGTMSGPLFSRLVGLDEIGSKRLLAGEKVDDFNPAASRCSSQINEASMAMWQLVSPMGGSRVLFGRFAWPRRSLGRDLPDHRNPRRDISKRHLLKRRT